MKFSSEAYEKLFPPEKPSKKSDYNPPVEGMEDDTVIEDSIDSDPEPE